MHLVLIGGGHANAALLPHVREIVASGHTATLISPEPTHYYSGMGPGMLGGSYAPAELRFPIADMCSVDGVTFVQARVTRIDHAERTLALSTGETVDYDLLSVNTGSSIMPTIDIDEDASVPVLPVKPIANLLEVQRHLVDRGERGAHIVVAGGGPAAVEIAGNLRKFVRTLGDAADEATTIELLTGRAVLPGFPPLVERRVARCLKVQRVDVCLGERVTAVRGDCVHTSQREIRPDLLLQATGVVPSRLFADSGLPVGKDGSLAVNRHLHSLEQKEIFGAGDCIWFTPEPLSRAGVFAVRQTPVLRKNLEAMVRDPSASLTPFSPGGGYLLLLNMGDDTAVFVRRVLGIPIVLAGKWVWKLKDWIDRRFMDRVLGGGNHGNE